MVASDTSIPGHKFRSDPASLLRNLFLRAEDHLTDAELNLVAGVAREDAETLLDHLQKLTQGIGCLVAADADGDGSRAGNFQSGEDVSNLLWALSDFAGYAHGLLNMSGFAEASIESRKAKKAEAAVPKTGGARRG